MHTILDEWTEEVGKYCQKNECQKMEQNEKDRNHRAGTEKNHKRREVGIAFEIQAENKRFKNEQFMNNNKAELRLRISIKMF